MVVYSQIGDRLKEARLEKGYTLEDLQQKTKIQRRYLIAIEEGKVEDLPDRYSVKAFIRQYAAAVELDGDVLIGGDVPVNMRSDTTQMEAGGVLMTRAERRRLRQKSSTGGEWHKRATVPTYLLVLLVLFILAVTWYFLYVQ